MVRNRFFQEAVDSYIEQYKKKKDAKREAINIQDKLRRQTKS